MNKNNKQQTKKPRRNSVKPKVNKQEKQINDSSKKVVTPYCFNPTPPKPRKSEKIAIKIVDDTSEDEVTGETTETMYSEPSIKDNEDQIETDICGKKRVDTNALQNNKSNKKQKVDNDDAGLQSSSDNTAEPIEHVDITHTAKNNPILPIPIVSIPMDISNYPISIPIIYNDNDHSKSNVNKNTYDNTYSPILDSPSEEHLSTNSPVSNISHYNTSEPKVFESNLYTKDNTTDINPIIPLSNPPNNPNNTNIDIPNPNNNNNNPIVSDYISNSNSNIPTPIIRTKGVSSLIPSTSFNDLSAVGIEKSTSTTDIGATFYNTITSLNSTVLQVLSTVNSIVTQGNVNQDSLLAVTDLVHSHCLPKIISLISLTTSINDNIYNIESRQSKMEDTITRLQQALTNSNNNNSTKDIQCPPNNPQKLFYYDDPDNTNIPTQTYTVYNKEEKVKCQLKMEEKRRKKVAETIINSTTDDDDDDNNNNGYENSNEEIEEEEGEECESSGVDSNDSNSYPLRNRNRNRNRNNNNNNNNRNNNREKDKKDAAALLELKHYKIYYYLLAKSFGFPLPKILKRDINSNANDSYYRIKTTNSTEFVTLSNCTVFDSTTILPKYTIARMAKQTISGKSNTTNPRYLITFDTAILLLQVVYDHMINEKKDHSIPIDEKYLAKLSKHILRKKQEIGSIKKTDTKNSSDLSKLSKIETLCTLITGTCSLYDTS